jgi:hypothetical protein
MRLAESAREAEVEPGIERSPYAKQSDRWDKEI